MFSFYPWLFRLCSFFPLAVLHVLGRLAAWLVFMLSKTVRQRILSNAAQAGYSFKQIRPSIAHMGKLLCETPRIWLGKPILADIKGYEFLEKAHATGRGVVLLTPHLGCFEITGQAYAQAFCGPGHPISDTDTPRRLLAMYRPARHPWLRAIMEGARNRYGMIGVPATLGGVKQMIKGLKAGHSVALLPDQVPPSGMGIWQPFFGKPAYTMTLAARLALQSQAEVVLMWGERRSWGRGYVVHFLPFERSLSSDLEQAVLEINLAMEMLIRLAPEQYLWEYPRYKLPRN